MTGVNKDYKYINENSPREKINYSYSEFGGEKFLTSWKKSRSLHLLDSKNEEISLLIKSNSITERTFLNWIKRFNDNNFSELNRLNLLIKRFEVTKRIYENYDEDFRRINTEDYNNSRLYVLFAYVLSLAYKKYHKLQFLNSLLKVNDINITKASELIDLDKNILAICIREELKYIEELRDKLR